MLSGTARKLFALQQLSGVGPVTLARLSTLDGFDSATTTELASADSRVARALGRPGAWDAALRAAEVQLEAACAESARIVSVLDTDYPALLKTAVDRPFFLYVKGTLPRDCDSSVAIIGTREPTEHGKVIAGRIADHFAAAGWAIVSGLALGCDGIAHEHALRHGARTVAVLAHGLHTISPKQHRQLAERILEHEGALITEYAFGVEPAAHQFAKRDRIQAGVSNGVIMIQSDLQGGSLHASRAAIEYKRFLAVPVPTERDLAANERKIQANCVLVGGDEVAKASLLHCKVEELSRVVVLRSKEDYASLSTQTA